MENLFYCRTLDQFFRSEQIKDPKSCCFDCTFKDSCSDKPVWLHELLQQEIPREYLPAVDLAFTKVGEIFQPEALEAKYMNMVALGIIFYEKFRKAIEFSLNKGVEK